MTTHHEQEEQLKAAGEQDDVRGHSISIGDSIARAAGTVLSTGGIGGIGSSLNGVDWGKVARDLIK
jgi:hypothetical protein